MSTTPARLLAAVSLVLTALLSGVSVLLQPEFPAGPADRLAAIDEAGSTATVSILAFAFAQLPFLVAVVATAFLAAAGARRTAIIGAVFAVLGGFGHAVFGGIGLSQLALAADAANREAMGEVITRIESGPAIVFMAMGLLGTVLGLVLLGVALFRSRAVPRWIPVALWLFLVMEFVGSGLTEWASPAAGLLYLAAFTGIARHIVWGAGPVGAVTGTPRSARPASSVDA
jgi:hypothetical protein